MNEAQRAAWHVTAGGQATAVASGPQVQPRGTGAGSRPEDPPARHDTRQRIQAIALELFAEQGYDKTSLREIAERLGVTKAALYYHFKSKEDIVASLVEDYFSEVDELIAWARTKPATPQSRAQILDRYFSIVANGSEVFRMLQSNQASVSSLASAKHRSELFHERMDALIGLLSEPGAPLPGQLRAAVALASVSFGCMFFAKRASDPAELRAAVLDIAYGLTGAQPG